MFGPKVTQDLVEVCYLTDIEKSFCIDFLVESQLKQI